MKKSLITSIALLALLLTSHAWAEKFENIENGSRITYFPTDYNKDGYTQGGKITNIVTTKNGQKIKTSAMANSPYAPTEFPIPFDGCVTFGPYAEMPEKTAIKVTFTIATSCWQMTCGKWWRDELKLGNIDYNASVTIDLLSDKGVLESSTISLKENTIANYTLEIPAISVPRNKFEARVCGVSKDHIIGVVQTQITQLNLGQ